MKVFSAFFAKLDLVASPTRGNLTERYQLGNINLVSLNFNHAFLSVHVFPFFDEIDHCPIFLLSPCSFSFFIFVMRHFNVITTFNTRIRYFIAELLLNIYI